MPSCRSCGNETGEGADFCPKCGQRLRGFTEEERQRYINDLQDSVRNEEDAGKEKKRREEQTRPQQGDTPNKTANALSRIGKVMAIAGAIVILAAGVILCTGPLFSPSVPDTPSLPDETPQTFAAITFAGTDDTITPPFELTTKEWIVDWSYSPDPDSPYSFFRLFIYPRGETLFSVLSVISPTAHSGSTYSYAGPGEYYLEVSTTKIASWQITIRPAP